MLTAAAAGRRRTVPNSLYTEQDACPGTVYENGIPVNSDELNKSVLSGDWIACSDT